MKSTAMELQAIREKLQLLQAEPPAAEALALPWSEPKRAALNSRRPRAAADKAVEGEHSFADQPVTPSAKPSPQAAIETLKQRSHSTDPAASDRIDNLVAQEMYRLEVQANHVNERSRQQAADIMALKRSAQQASVGLRRQGIHDHPQLIAITQFLQSYPSAVVPHIEKDDQGHFTLTYDTVDFHRAEQEAIDTAQALRNRQQSASAVPLTPFSQSIGASSAVFEAIPKAAPKNISENNWIKNSWPKNNWIIAATSSTVAGLSQLNQLLGEIFAQRERSRRPKQKQSPLLIEEGFDLRSTPYPNSPFSWLDGTIWFSGAAIVRIVVQSIAASYPMIQTILLIALVGVIVFALYRVVVSKSNDYGLVYRLCIGIMGLLSGGLL
jgi:hypothetical protein